MEPNITHIAYEAVTYTTWPKCRENLKGRFKTMNPRRLTLLEKHGFAKL